MKKILLPAFLNCFFALFLQALDLHSLICEYKTNPLGIDEPAPRLSWKISDEGRNVMQAAYQIRVSSAADFSAKNAVWESGKVASDQSLLVAYAGPALQSARRYYWQVKIWDNKGRESAWSATAFWETGLLQTSDWKAQWIELDKETPRYSPSPLFRKSFNLKKNIVSARAYVTAHGFYELYVNGAKVGDQVLAPGWTSYNKRLQYQVYDITSMLKKGPNAVGAMLGDGWYRGTLGWVFQWGIYGKRLGLLCQIEATYSDGSVERIVSDGSWKGSDEGPVRMSDIYNGETYDARMEINGWSAPAFDDRAWPAVRVAQHPIQHIVATSGLPVRKIQELKPVRIFRTPKGELVADMGQNMVGWVRLTMRGQRGLTVSVEHAEVLDKKGNFYTENLRSAKCIFQYTLSGAGEETAEPRFTFMGFRYVKIDNYPGELTPAQLTGVVVHSDMAPTGSFECSNALLNQLQHNIQWGQKGNFVDVPTDCPQRDERLGWTGDAQAFARTAAFNMDVASFFTKWLADVAADQKPGGEIPFVIPDVLNPQGSDKAGVSAGWSDVVCIIPWNMYLIYGDKRLLERQYPSMKAWVEYMRSKAGQSNIYKNGSVFGDWLFYRPAPHDASEPDGYTDRDYLSTAFYAYSTDLLAQAAEVLGKTDEAAEYRRLRQAIKAAFQHEYASPSGRLISDSQTADVLALVFGLYEPAQRQKIVDHLASDVRRRRNHLSTGFLGTPYLTHALSDNDSLQLAYNLLFQETYPSWLYPVKMGATTIWERWDGIKTDSTFQDKGMNSFNHYAYGAIGDWMYRVTAGIEIGKPGYKHVIFRPRPTERLDWAEARYESRYGPIRSRWDRKDGKMSVQVHTPPNTSATVFLPAAAADQIMESDAPLRASDSIRNIRAEKGGIAFEIGSGSYRFTFAER